MAEPEPQRIVFVGFEGVQTIDVTGPWEVFNTAGLIAGAPPDLRLLTIDGGDVRSSSGLSLRADGAIGKHRGAIDTLVVPGGLGVRDAVGDPDLVATIAGLAGRARRVAAVCTGAFLLAEAGLLEGRRATTHWASCERLAERYPAVAVDADPIFVRDGNVMTSAGVTAGMDLALSLVEDDHGIEVARAVARWMVLFVQRPGGQSQFSERLAHPIPSDSSLRAVCDEIVADPRSDHSVPRLAQRAALSERHFARLFIAQTGTTPARFVERARVEAARGLLEGSPAPVETIAEQAGFGSAETMRRAFVRVLGVAPADYRARFGTTHLHVVDERLAG